MTSSLIRRLRGRFANRRAEPRQKARLPLRLSLYAPGARRPQAVDGYTRDLSPSGLGLVIPAADSSLPGPGILLHVLLLLEKRRVQLRVAPVRRAPLEPGGGESGHLVGARIVEISEGDRALLTEHLKKLRLLVKDYAP